MICPDCDSANRCDCFLPGANEPDTCLSCGRDRYDVLDGVCGLCHSEGWEDGGETPDEADLLDVDPEKRGWVKKQQTEPTTDRPTTGAPDPATGEPAPVGPDLAAGSRSVDEVLRAGKPTEKELDEWSEKLREETER